MAQFAATILLSGVETLTRTQVKKALSAAMISMGRRWEVRYLPKHFTTEGGREYGYRQRGRAYDRKKAAFRKKKGLPGGVMPNRYTDQLYNQTIGSPRKMTAKTPPGRGTLSISLPRRANFQIHEFKIVSDREQKDLEEYLTEQIEIELSAAGDQVSAGVTLEVQPPRGSGRSGRGRAAA